MWVAIGGLLATVRAETEDPAYARNGLRSEMKLKVFV
jgi:hypothetical protein